MPTYTNTIRFNQHVTGTQPPSTGTNVYTSPVNGFAVIKISANGTIQTDGTRSMPSIVVNSRQHYFDIAYPVTTATVQASMWVTVGGGDVLAISTGAGQTAYFYGIEFVNTF